MKKLHFIQCVPDDTMFHSEVLIQLVNFREMGYSSLARVLVFLPEDRLHIGFNPKWKELEGLFPETKFFYYKDPGFVLQDIRRINYISLLRPYCLSEHFKEFPELSDDAVFFQDSDILFIKPIDFTPLLSDDIHYLSYTGNRLNRYNYICADHFDDKVKNARPGMEEEAKEVLQQMLSYFDVLEDEFREKKEQIGGAQYLLKNIDAKFWWNVYEACIQLKPFVASRNQQLMKGDTPQQKEDNGFQSWCMDMYGVLLTIWQRKEQTLCPPEMDFLWATDPIDKWDDYYIFHNAGGAPDLFNKRAYANNDRTPFQDDLSWVNKNFCSYNYVNAITKTKQIFNL